MERLLSPVQAVDGELVVGIESRCEERESLNVIPMGVPYEDVALDRLLLELTEQRQPEHANPGAGIRNQQLFAAAHLGTGAFPQ